MREIQALKSELKNNDTLGAVKRLKAENLELKYKLKNAAKGVPCGANGARRRGGR